MILLDRDTGRECLPNQKRTTALGGIRSHKDIQESSQNQMQRSGITKGCEKISRQEKRDINLRGD